MSDAMHEETAATSNAGGALLLGLERSSTQLAHGLAGLGVSVRGADSQDAALSLLRAHQFDLLVCDADAAALDSSDLVRRVRSIDLDLPVVLMTDAPFDSAAASAGVFDCVTHTSPMPTIQATLRRAIELGRLARAKRDALRALSPHEPEAGDRVGLEVTLQRALHTLWIAYQPIVNAQTLELFGYEALLRSGEPALPHPGAVLSAAERLGRVHDVGRAVRARAPEPMSRAPEAMLFINLHASDLADDELTAATGPLSPIASRVVLEITERASLEHVPDARDRVLRLRERGFRIAIDDLGAGYAGLNSFAQLEPDFVKLDMSLIRDVHCSPIKRKLVQSMTSLCRDMGIVVVAEGIEVPEERDVVVELGCDLLQGYLLAKPGAAFPPVQR